MTRDPLIVPPAFARHWVSEGEHEWVVGLPAQAAAAMRRWDLTADGEPLHGWCAVVLPVRAADGTPAMLKITRPHPEAEHEALALSTWDGDGAVRLLAAEPWELLLERLDPAHSLDDEPLPVALGVITSLLRRLDRRGCARCATWPPGGCASCPRGTRPPNWSSRPWPTARNWARAPGTGWSTRTCTSGTCCAVSANRGW